MTSTRWFLVAFVAVWGTGCAGPPAKDRTACDLAGDFWDDERLSSIGVEDLSETVVLLSSPELAGRRSCGG
jgi:hypothetical protein